MFRFLCDGAKQLGQTRGSSRTYLSFYAVSMCELIASTTKVSEELLERLLPYIVEGLAETASTDYRAATLMLLAELSTRSPLSQGFLSGQCAFAFLPVCKR